MKRFLLTIFTILLVLVVFPIAAKADVADPTQKVNRLRLVISTTSDWTHVEMPAGVTILRANERLLSGQGNLNYDSKKVYMWGNIWGSPASVQFDILLTTDGVSDESWQILKGWQQTTHLDVYNLNQINNPVLITSQDCSTFPEAKIFTLSGSAASQGGPLSAGEIGSKKVFASYYPWWPTRESWAIQPGFGVDDLPIIPYGTSQQSDVAADIDRAQSSGIDGFFSSWQGQGNGSDDGMRALIAAANQKTNFSVAAYMETRVANRAHAYSCLPNPLCQPDPTYIKQWIQDIVQTYGSAPSYLKMDKKMPDGTIKSVPVIVIYWVGDTRGGSGSTEQNGGLAPDTWRNIFADLHSQGIDAFYIADTGDPAYLDVFDGLHRYHLMGTSGSNSERLLGAEAAAKEDSLAVKTYSLFDDTQAQRKLYMGTVSPGMDTSWTSNGQIVNREAGAFYAGNWNAVTTQFPDWIMITSWNEFCERTYIEASIKYGSLYQDLTKTNSDQYKGSSLGSSLQLEVSASRIYWSDYASYYLRKLTVESRITNTGANDVRNVTITQLYGSEGVTTLDWQPQELGTIAAQSDKFATSYWQIPEGVSVFRIQLWAQAETVSGTKIYFPRVPD